MATCVALTLPLPSFLSCSPSKTAMLFMAGVMLAIICIFLGTFTHMASPERSAGIVGMTAASLARNMGPGYTGDYNFAAMLAIFFPAVTDPLAGSNLSGDLENPQKSIPPGTIAAVLTTTAIFCAMVVFTGGSIDRETLIADQLIVTQLAWPTEEIVYVGMLMSTLGKKSSPTSERRNEQKTPP